jgi:putative membrane protein
VPGEKGTLLRTRQGLFKTREVNRDDNRLRGVEIAEPLLWRWMGMADTTIITTGLDASMMSTATTIVPRGPIDVARSVAAHVLEEGSGPLETPVERHPGAALRRRLVWATLTAAGIVGILVWLAATGVVPWWSVLVGGASLPVALWGAWVAYRALGHAINGAYLVVRSGLLSRSTAALQRKAVSTVAIRESVLQRRLGLKTVSAMTAAGWGIYEAPDVDAAEAVPFAMQAAPGLLEPFLVRD